MRVLQINVLAFDRSTGRTTAELNDFLVANGHESFVAFGIGDKVNGERYFKIGNPVDYYHHNILARITGKQGFYSKTATKRLVKWIEQIKPDVVHLRNLHSNYINLNILFNFLSKNKIPVVFTTHDFWFMTAFCPYPKQGCDISRCDKCAHFSRRFNPSKVFSMKKEGLLSINKVGIQANSEFSLSVVRQSFLKDAIADVIYNWIDFKKFYPDSSNDPFHTEKPVVLSIWSLLDENQDRFKFFVKIADLLHDKYTFAMVGSHSFNESKYPNVVFYPETKDINVLRQYYSCANILFNPSTTDTFGKVVAESISCGTPCVVFNNQALPELVGKNECGVVVAPFSVEESISAINQVVDAGKEQYKDLCLKKSRTLFDMDTNCHKIIELYKKVIKKNE